MISQEQMLKELQLIVKNGIREDIGDGDHSSLACIPEDAFGQARLLVKEEGILAGVEFAKMIFHEADPDLKIEVFLNDGDKIKPGDVAFYVTGRSRSILMAERLVLNAMQRMSAIATKTRKFVKKLKGTETRILDTRKTTPGIRAIEKWAVKIGGGVNHRFALYDMIMLKDNHNDYSGGISMAVEKSKEYLKQNNLDLKIEVETRNLSEVEEALSAGADIIMLDNMTLDQLSEAVTLVDGKVQTEASGGINESTITSIAETGVDYISVGALTHSYKSLDMSLKASLA